MASVQVTLAETDGAAARANGHGHDHAGSLRETVQNHLLHIVALLAMEPPAGRHFDAVQRHKADVYAALRPLGPSDIVRGQYRGYRDEPGVAKDSDAETFCALRVHVDSWRWGGVPWYLRAGKRLPLAACEVVVRFKTPPQNLFGDAAVGEDANHLRLRLAPAASTALGLRVKRAGHDFAGVPRDVVLQSDAVDTAWPHEQLLAGALAGDRALFARREAIESAWTAVDPVLLEHPPVHLYDPGTWGPPAANHFIAGDGGWRNPEAAAAAPASKETT